jgi:hypothetical protein
MAFGTRLRRCLGLVFLVVSLVTTDAVVMDGFGMVLHLLGRNLFLGGLVGFHLFFQFTGHLSGGFVAFDATLDLIAHLQIIQGFALVVVVAFAAADFVLFVVLLVTEGHDAFGMLTVGLVVHLDHVLDRSGRINSACGEHQRHRDGCQYNYISFTHFLHAPLANWLNTHNQSTSNFYQS